MRSVAGVAGCHAPKTPHVLADRTGVQMAHHRTKPGPRADYSAVERRPGTRQGGAENNCRTSFWPRTLRGRFRLCFSTVGLRVFRHADTSATPAFALPRSMRWLCRPTSDPIRSCARAVVSAAFVDLLQECFYFGMLLKVAKVV